MTRGTNTAPRRAEGEIIIEFQTIRRSVRVSAIDAATLTEVSIVAPASASERQMTDAVVKKLRYVLARRRDA
jgi:hypothetical protein